MKKKKPNRLSFSFSLAFFLRVASFLKNAMRKSKSISNLKKSFVFCTDEKWKELSVDQRQEKEHFLKSEEHVSKSCMQMVCCCVNLNVEFVEVIINNIKAASFRRMQP